MTAPDNTVPAGVKPKTTDKPIDLRTADARTVLAFHRNDDVDARSESHHHTLGKSHSQASPGPHVHDGGTSEALLSTTITGSRANNTADILNQLLNELTKIGLVNGTST